MPPAKGIAAIRAIWVKAFSRPGFSFSWKPGNVVIAESGTLATSTGSWRMTAPNGSGPYLAVWRKQMDGTWKIVVDSSWFSSGAQ